MPIAESALHLIGKTPLIKLNSFSTPGGASIWAKLESINPGGSIKDRICLAMIEDAEARGVLRPGMEVVEPTSGNTGIGLAMVCAVKGYSLTLAMPETMSVERRSFLQAFGAKIELTPAPDGSMSMAMERAEELASQDGWYMPGQFSNPANSRMHLLTTGPEIWKQTGGNVRAFVAGVGTGGTITGVGQFLKGKSPDVHIVAVEPTASAVLSGGTAGEHNIQGIGAGFVPPVLDRSVIDQMCTVDDDEAMVMTNRLASQEGLLVGISSGANVFAAQKIAKELNPEDNVVTILCDTGHRYLTVEGFIQRPEEHECL